MTIPRTLAFLTLTLVTGASLGAGTRHAAADEDSGQEKKKPKVSVRATPQAGFSPMRVVLTAELRGGDNDHPEFYCPTVEWVWGDDTRAESTGDCDPYAPGTSEIQRRYTVSRVFNTAGEFKIEFRVKQRDKVVGSGSTTVRVQPGVRDGGGESR